VSQPTEDRDSTELARAYSEYFKHFTTLSATAAVGAAALKDVADIGGVYVSLCLLCFGVCLIISLGGMNRMLTAIRLYENLWEGDFARGTRAVAELAGYTFLLGIGFFAGGATSTLPFWPTMLAIVLVVGLASLGKELLQKSFRTD
jgi:hypothetical protein